jgi:hypothetical protein
MRMRAAWTALLALCLALTSASAGRAPRLDVARNHRAPDAALDAAPATTHAISPRRRDAVGPERGLAPPAVPVAVFTLAPPDRHWSADAASLVSRPARPLATPRSSRGPPLG